MPRIKKLRQDFFHIQFQDPTLKLYDPYFRISVIPAKKTFSGEHDKKIMLSVGRRFNEEKATKFFNSDNPLKQKIIEKLSKEVNISQENIIKAQKTGKLKDLLIEAVAFQVKHLGIPVIIYKKKASYELFEYVKTSDIGEVAQIVYGSLVGLGKAIKLFSENPEEELIYWKIHIKKNVDKFIERGYYD